MLGPGSAATDAGYDIGADEYVVRVYLPLVLRSFP